MEARLADRLIRAPFDSVAGGTLLSPGQPTTARSCASPEHIFEGEVSLLDNEVDAVTRSIRLRALIPSEQGLLRPGMLMTVYVESEPRRALVIPESVPTSRLRSRWPRKSSRLRPILIPVLYSLLARTTGAPYALQRQLEAEEGAITASP